MNITNTYKAGNSLPIAQKYIDLGISILQTNMGLKSTESLLVVTDPAMEKTEGALWYEAGKTITPDTSMIVFEGMAENAQEPPKEVITAMQKASAVMLQTTYSLSHTQARIEACRLGVRMASLPTTTISLLERTLATDYMTIQNDSLDLAEKLTKGSQVILTAPNRTNITFSIEGRAGDPDTGFYTKPGDFGNLPAGEAYIAPVEGSANGIFIVDGSFADLSLDQPICIQVENGQATSISGGSAAKTLNILLNQVGSKARNIAELGIGTNPSANPKGSLIEAEKAYGTVHIALGANATFGGTVSVPFHSDGVILNPTLKIDNQVIIKDGEFTI